MAGLYRELLPSHAGAGPAAWLTYIYACGERRARPPLLLLLLLLPPSSLLPPLWFDSNRHARGIRFCSVLLGAVVAEIIEYMREREVIPTFAAESFPGEEGLMENLYGPNSRLARMRALLGNFPEINTRRMDSNLLQGRGRQRHFQMNQNIDTYSPIVKFLLSKSPSSAVENNDSISPVMVNMEEDTLVVDGVLLKSVSGGPSSGNSRHKRSTYRAGEENCLFSYGSKRHHVHGKEEQALRFSPFAMKASPEVWNVLSNKQQTIKLHVR
ncbi:hypothetical protein EUGRSUZ_I02692 [Eucalyptus grandis]|uniref:Uncharacterized protein n=2 Tax=Eucalyptus grandis TaxID=71139 RepID=A0ACC3JJV4_EUCGR|nr:hypothetical protein EUGRSUZ_I02692 [Eucalyptus grandis]